MKNSLLVALMLAAFFLHAQMSPEIVLLKKTACTAVKNQAATGTCWSFSTTSLIESQTLKAGMGEVDLSEMFTVRNIYTEKAKNYILRQGHAQFGAGGLGHDVIRAISTYGAMPENAYSGLLAGKVAHDHTQLDKKLKLYLDSLLTHRPIPQNWMIGFQSILNDHLGNVPETFMYKERQYTAKTFALDVLHFNSGDYVTITSFTHHPFYKPFILEVPDNFLNGSYYNVPVEELLKITERAIEKGFSVMWDTDVSNKFFDQESGFALQVEDGATANPEGPEIKYDQALRQALFENLTTQDDHLMHLVGLEKTKNGKKFFLVKNSWGETGAYKGFIHVSETYFAINTISLVVPRAALESSLKQRLGLK